MEYACLLEVQCVGEGGGVFILSNFSVPPPASTEVGMTQRPSESLVLGALLSPENKPSTTARPGGVTRLARVGLGV